MSDSATMLKLVDASTSDSGGSDSARERILTAVGLLFNEIGVNAVSVEQLVSQAGTSRRELYRHFSTKRELLAAYVANRSEVRYAQLDALRAAYPGDPRAVLMAFAHYVDECDQENQPGSFVHLAAEISEPGNPIREAIIELRKTSVAFMAEQLRELGHRDPETLAHALLMVLTGAVTAATLEAVAGRSTAERAFASLIDHGL
jgi:AcrR family transcriptional regulator